MGEELGFVGVAFLLLMYLLIIARGLWLASQAGSTFGRLLAGAFVLTFFSIRFCQRRNGEWHLASGRVPALGQLWRDLRHYAHGGSLVSLCRYALTRLGRYMRIIWVRSGQWFSFLARLLGVFAQTAVFFCGVLLAISALAEAICNHSSAGLYR